MVEIFILSDKALGAIFLKWVGTKYPLLLIDAFDLRVVMEAYRIDTGVPIEHAIVSRTEPQV